MDVSVDPVSTQLNHILAHPSLIFWGLFGSFFSRKNEMVVAARAPLNLGGSHTRAESEVLSKAKQETAKTHVIASDLRKFAEQHGDVVGWNESNRAYF